MKKISVAIPAYNHAKYIGDAIDSVIKSEYANLEIIVVDDGSTDHTRSVVSDFKDVIYVFQPNAGAHNALNSAIQLATGEYIAILNDDDMFMPEHLSVAIENLETYGNKLFIGTPTIIGEGPKLEVLNHHLEYSKLSKRYFGIARSLLHINWSVSTSAFVFDKQLATSLGGFHNFSMCHDLDFLLRALLSLDSSLGTSSVPTWYYRCHETNAGSSIALAKQKAEIVYSLGRMLAPIMNDIPHLDLSALIGYDLDHELISKALLDKPWMQEELMPISESISRWIGDIS